MRRAAVVMSYLRRLVVGGVWRGRRARVLEQANFDHVEHHVADRQRRRAGGRRGGGGGHRLRAGRITAHWESFFFYLHRYVYFLAYVLEQYRSTHEGISYAKYLTIYTEDSHKELEFFLCTFWY